MCYCSRIRIDGSQVIPVPLFEPLDGKNRRDYVARVEPSAKGGKKMAEFLLDLVDNNNPIQAYKSYQSPIQSFMKERY